MDEKKVIIAYHKRRQARLDSKEAPRKDGGPGSGHWGHVGVPGVRGGSAPGGGNAYRIENDRFKAGTKGTSGNAPKYTSRAQIINGHQTVDEFGNKLWKKDDKGNYILDSHGRKIPEGWHDGLKQRLEQAKADKDRYEVRRITDTLNKMTGSEKGAERALDRKTAWNKDVIDRMVKEGKMTKGSAYYNHAMKMAQSTASVKSLNKTASKDIMGDKKRGKSTSMRNVYHGRTTKEAKDRLLRKGYR